MTHEHFQGKDALGHVISARKKGQAVSLEPHGIEPSGLFFAFIDTFKETALLFGLYLACQLGSGIQLPFSWLLSLSAGWILWKTARSALLGWGRLFRVHQVIEEERFEITHHREQEKEELKALYQAKGFSGKLLDEVIEVLMADDNRLLQVMLEEELGLPLGTYEHPLRQASGAFLGSFFTLLFLNLACIFLPLLGILLLSVLLILSATYFGSQKEHTDPLLFTGWTLGITLLCFTLLYLLNQRLS